MIHPPSPTTTIIPPSLQTLLMMPGNTTTSIESNTIQIVTTITAAGMVARIRTGIVTFPPPDAQFAEPTEKRFLNCTVAEAVYEKEKQFQSSQ